MGEAALWGLVGASSLVLGASVARVLRPSQRATGLIMAFGAGVLISAVAYELVLEALDSEVSLALVGIGLGVGAVTFYLGDLAIDRAGGAHRKRSTGAQAEGSSLAIALGALLDGIPESLVLGLSLLLGEGIGVALIAAVFLSNLPEAIAASIGMQRAGWPEVRILGLWTGIMLASGLAAAVGYAVFAGAPTVTGALVQAFAAGAMLTMLADTMMPEAFEFGGRAVGLLTVLGFALAAGLSAMS